MVCVNWWSRSTHLDDSRSLWMTITSGSPSNFCLAVTEYGVALYVLVVVEEYDFLGIPYHLHSVV